MIPDLDVYRAASVLIKRYGADAPLEAAMRVDAMLEVGDLDERAAWQCILAAVEELLRVGAASGERVH